MGFIPDRVFGGEHRMRVLAAGMALILAACSTSGRDVSVGPTASTAAAPVAAPPNFDFPSVMQPGEKDEAVGRFQVLLNDSGCAKPSLKVDNDYGAKTQAAVTRLQTLNNLAGMLGVADHNAQVALENMYEQNDNTCGQGSVPPPAGESAAPPAAAPPDTAAPSAFAQANGCEPGSKVYGVHLPEGTRAITLSFDDGPANKYTAEVMDILDANGVTGTFFDIGIQVDSHPSLAVEEVKRGFELGNHTSTHPTPSTDDNIPPTMEAGLNAIRNATNVTPRYFRSPQYAEGPNILAEAARLGECDILATQASALSDWEGSGYSAARVKAIEDKFAEAIEASPDNNIFVFHDGGDSQLNMIPALKFAIKYAKDKGIQIVGLHDLLTMGTPITSGPPVDDK